MVNSSIYKIYYILLAIIILGCILRIYGLASESLWYDEVCSIEYIKQDFSNILFRSRSSPPLYFLLLKLWTGLFGVKTFVVRFLSVIFGVLSIALIFKVGKLLFNELTGIYSALILSISPLHIFYAQETRNFTLFVFLALLTIFLFEKLVSDSRIKNYFYFILISFALLITHFYGIFVIACLNAFFLTKIKNKKQIKDWLISQAVIFALFIPLLFMLFLNLEKIKIFGLFWINKPDFFPALFDTLRTFSSGGRSFGGCDIFLGQGVMKVSSNLTYLFLALFILGLISSLIKNYEAIPNKFLRIIGFYFAPERKNDTALLVLLWLFLPILLPLLFSIFLFPIYVIRHTIAASPAFYILAAKGITSIKRDFLRILVIIMIVCLTLPMLGFYYNNDIKVPWDKMVDYLNKKMALDTLIVYYPLDRELTMYYYFPSYGHIEIKSLELLMGEKNEKKLDNLGYKHIALIDFNPRWGGKREVDSVNKYLDGHWLKKNESSFGGVYVAYYEYKDR